MVFYIIGPQTPADAEIPEETPAVSVTDMEATTAEITEAEPETVEDDDGNCPIQYEVKS